MQKFKRHVLKRDELTDAELDILASLERSYKPLGSLPAPLRIDLETKKATHHINYEDTKKGTWIAQIQEHGLLQTEASAMIGHICKYIETRWDRIRFSNGNTNDPTNLISFEFLSFLALVLAKAPCNEDTLILVKKRCEVLDNILNSGAFQPGYFHARTTRGMLVSVQNILSRRVMVTIQREIANTSALGHLRKLLFNGKIVLSTAIQLLYYMPNDTESTPYLNITRFRRIEPDYQKMAATRLGKLLQTLFNVAEIRTLYSEEYEKGSNPSFQSIDTISKPGQPRKESLRDLELASNPFLDKDNRPCIPSFLANTQKIEDYLNLSNGPIEITKSVGVFSSLQKNPEYLKDYGELFAIIVWLAKILVECEKAKKLAGIGGDLLVYAITNDQINQTMITIADLLSKLQKHQAKLVVYCNRVYEPLTRDKQTKLPENIHWVKNYTRIPSLQATLTKYIDESCRLANAVRHDANMISKDDLLERAERRLKTFQHNSRIVTDQIRAFTGKGTAPVNKSSRSGWTAGVTNKSQIPSGRITSSTPKVELLPDDDTEEATKPAQRQQVSLTLRTSMTDLRGILKQKKQASAKKPPALEGNSESGTSPRPQLSASLRNSRTRIAEFFKPPASTSELAASPASPRNEAKSETTTSPRPRLGESLRRSFSNLVGRIPQNSVGDTDLPRVRKKTVTTNSTSTDSTETSPRSSRATETTPAQKELGLQSTSASPLNPVTVIERPKQPVDKKIHLIGNNKSEQYLDELTLDWFLIESLKAKPEADEVHVQKNKIGGVGAVKLCQRLLKHAPLVKLICSDNTKLFSWIDSSTAIDIEAIQGWGAARAFCELLRAHSSLRELVIINCGLNTDGARLFAQALKDNTSLETLDLCDNHIGDTGAIAICNSLGNHASIRFLLIAGNQLSDHAGEAFLELLRKNSLITFLEVGNNKISDALMERIYEQLKLNQRQGASLTNK